MSTHSVLTNTFAIIPGLPMGKTHKCHAACKTLSIVNKVVSLFLMVLTFPLLCAIIGKAMFCCKNDN